MTTEPSPGPGRLTGGRLGVAVTLVAILALTGAFLAGRLTAPSADLPTTSSAAAGFARDMQVHHGQAVELALIVRDLTDDADVRLLAYDIATSQSNQSGQMKGWIEVWGLPQASTDPPMTWMQLPTIDEADEHGHSAEPHEAGAPMPGMASAEDIDRLESLSGVDAERLFLELMIEHHLGGVEMAEGLLARSTNEQAVSLATAIVASQSGEIDYMRELLAER